LCSLIKYPSSGVTRLAPTCRASRPFGLKASGKTPEAAVREAVSAAKAMIGQGAEVKSEKSLAAAAMGRAGGAKGGAARAAALSKKERSEIAKKAAKARWG